MSVVDHFLDENGWKFSSEEETAGCIPDTVNGCKFLKELYFLADPAYNARFTVPVLWDRKLKTIGIIRINFFIFFIIILSCNIVNFEPTKNYFSFH